MSLQVWLPLTGDLRNQGLSVTTFTGTPTWKTYGKLMNSSLNLQNRITCSTPALNGIQFFSIAFWSRIEANPDSTANWMDIIGFTDVSTSGSTGQFRFETGYGNTAYGGIHWHDNATNAIINGSYTYNTASEYNNWHHIVVTISDIAVKSYYDGQLKHTYTTNLNKGHLNGNWWLGENTTRGCIQDVRIYDHALSDKEVEEISKGLVLHYKLDQPVGLIDLAKKTIGVYNNYSSSGTTGTLTALSETYEGYTIYRENMTPNDSSISNFKGTLHSHGIYSGGYTFKANTKYVYWVYYRPVTNISDIRVGGVASNIGGWTEIPPVAMGNGWYRVGQYRNGSVTTDKSDNVFVSFYTPSAASGTTITIDWGPSFMIEGTTEIPEINNFGDNIVCDSSGYQKNGTILGVPVISNDTSRYLKSTSFNGTDNGILISNQGLASILNYTCSISFWIKSTEENGGRSIYFSSYNGSPFWCIEKSSGNKFRYDWNGNPDLYSTGSILDNTWNFICFVRESATSAKFYLNGNLDTTWTNTCNALTNLVDTWRIARDVRTNDGTPYKGDMSDFRIYATALTAEQVLDLYHTSATIDKEGNMYAREVVE